MVIEQGLGIRNVQQEPGPDKGSNNSRNTKAQKRSFIGLLPHQNQFKDVVEKMHYAGQRNGQIYRKKNHKNRGQYGTQTKARKESQQGHHKGCPTNYQYVHNSFSFGQDTKIQYRTPIFMV